MTLSPDAIEWFRSFAVAGLVLAGAGVAAEVADRRRRRTSDPHRSDDPVPEQPPPQTSDPEIRDSDL